MKLALGEKQIIQDSAPHYVLRLLFFFGLATLLTRLAELFVGGLWVTEHREGIYLMSMIVSAWPSWFLATLVIVRFKVPLIALPNIGVVDGWLIFVAIIPSGLAQRFVREQGLVHDKLLQSIIGFTIFLSVPYLLHTWLKRYEWFQQANQSESLERISLVTVVIACAILFVSVAVWGIVEYSK